MSVYTDDQACVVASVDGGPYSHQRTIPAWAARDKAAADTQRRVVRLLVRDAVGRGPRITVSVIPGYCDRCKGVAS